PELITLDSTIDFTARSISASFKTIAGALPPNSKLTFVIFLLADSITLLPEFSDPVIETIPTFGLEASSSPIFLPRPVTKLNTPLGKFTSSTNFVKNIALFGDSPLGLITAVFPVIKAGAIFLAIKKNGKFHGRIPVVTPIALLKSKIVSFGRSLGIISPSYLLAHSAI